MPRPAGARAAAIAVAALALLLPAASASAQILALPVLQNGFANRGFAAGVNYGSAKGVRSYAVAASFATPGSRFAASIGAGVYDPTGDASTGLPNRSTLGLRIAVMGPRLMNRAVGLAGFVGVGGMPRKDDQAGVTTVPAGVAIGYRRALGASRGISLYAAPFYSWARSSLEGDTKSQGVFRVSAGLDVALIQRLGMTIGSEVGGKAKAGYPGPASAVFGAGLAYAFR